MANEILRYIEISEEPEYPDVDIYVPKAQGTGVYINQASTTLDLPGDTDIEVDTSFGRGAADTEPGYYSPSGNVAYPTVLSTLGHFLKGTLGGYAYTAGVAGAQETQTLTIAGPAGASGGSFSFTLPDVNDVARTYNLSAAANATVAQISNQIRAVSIAGWEASGAGANTTFTRSIGSATSTLGTFNPGSSGIPASNFTQGQAGAAGTPDTHEFWGSDARILPSWLVRVGKDIFEHGFQGCIMESCELAVDDGLTTCSVEMNGQKDFKAAEGLQSKVDVLAALPKDRKIPFHQVAITIDGVLQKRKAKNLTWSITNGSDTAAGRYLGSRYPGRIPANERAVTASTTLDFSDMDTLEKVWGGPSGPTDEGGARFPATFHYNGGRSPLYPSSPTQTLDVRFPSTKYSGVETQPSGREEMSQPVTFTARTGEVTLQDGVTKIATDVYIKLKNYVPVIQPPA